MNQRDFLNLYISTALLISAACVHVSVNSIKLDSEVRDSIPIISSEKGRTVIAALPKAFSTPPAAITERKQLETDASTAAMLCGVESRLYACLIQRESNWDPRAVSASGAVGLSQIKPSTARELSPTLDVSVPWQNLLAGACYLRQLYDKNGRDWLAALHSYHAGPYRSATSEATEQYAQDILSCAYPTESSR